MNMKIISSITFEYGFGWVLNRGLYSAKIKLLNIVPKTEKFFEKRIGFPKQVDIFHIDVKYLEVFIKNLSKADRSRLVEDADKACKGKILGFCSTELDYGYPINWQLNPLTKKECDASLKWYQIPDFDAERGDIKLVWEISRFAHFVILARAYMLTENEKYYKAFSQQLDDWLEKNPYPYGANFKCGQECALRMVNALLAYTVFEKYGKATNLDRKNIKRLVARSYRKILSNFFYAYKCIKNNHTISELTGMIIGAWCCDDKIRLADAFKMLDEVIDEQFTEDGGYKQFSFNYTRLALQNIEVILAVEKKVGCELSVISRRKIQNAIHLMFQCQSNYGYMPNYGSNDGALAFPLTSCEYRDFRPIINTLHALLSGEMLYASDNQDEELLWFGGESAKSFKRRTPERYSIAFKQAGIYTMRNRNVWLMLVLNEYHSRPAHMDQMHIDLWIDDVNVLCDGGTFSYVSEMGRELVLNSSHNTAVYEKKPQMNSYGAFLLYDWTKCKRIKSNEDLFDGEMQSKKGYIHRRKIKTTNFGYEINDLVKGKEGERFEIRFHTPCEVQIGDKDVVNMLLGEKCVCSMRFDAPVRVYKASRSLYYLKLEEINCIIVSGQIQAGRGIIKTEILCKGVL